MHAARRPLTFISLTIVQQTGPVADSLPRNMVLQTSHHHEGGTNGTKMVHEKLRRFEASFQPAYEIAASY